MAQKNKKKPIKRLSQVKNKPVVPIYTMGSKVFFILAIADIIVQGKIESINTIQKPIYEGAVIKDIRITNYYTLSVDGPEGLTETTISEDNLYPTQNAASLALGLKRTVRKN